MAETKAPKAPLEIQINIGSESWQHVRDTLANLLFDIDAHESFGNIVSGGGGGHYSVTVERREVNIAQYRDELDDYVLGEGKAVRG